MGKLILLGMPIGNIQDISSSALTAMEKAELIAAEDTRKFFRMSKELNLSLKAKVISYHDSAEQDRLSELLAALRSNQNVLVLSDAGMPTISDPGFRIVAAAIEEGHQVSTIPGPSAVTSALAISGLPTNRFCFEGFLSRKSSERLHQLEKLKNEERTMVFFEAPHRLHLTLKDMATVFGESRVGVICREITKTYEEVVRGSVSDLVSWSSGEVRGEITLVIAGCGDGPKLNIKTSADQERIKQLVLQHPLAKENRKAAIAAVASEFNLPKREVYDLVMKSGKD